MDPANHELFLLCEELGIPSGFFGKHTVHVYFPAEATPTVAPSPTPTVAPSPTPTVLPTLPPTVVLIPTLVSVPSQAVHRIQLRTENGFSLEGAPYELYAPIASQADVQAYATGVVGYGNILELIDIPSGLYRLVIRPIGIDPIDVTLAIGTDSEELVLRIPGPNPDEKDGVSRTNASITSSNSSETVPVVIGLPSTGSATPSGDSWITFVVTASLMSSAFVILLVPPKKRRR